MMPNSEVIMSATPMPKHKLPTMLTDFRFHSATSLFTLRARRVNEGTGRLRCAGAAYQAPMAIMTIDMTSDAVLQNMSTCVALQQRQSGSGRA